MKNTNMKLSKEVNNTLKHYTSQVHRALEATQKLSNIAVSMRLASMFGISETQTAKMIQEDYLLET